MYHRLILKSFIAGVQSIDLQLVSLLAPGHRIVSSFTYPSLLPM